MLIEDFNGHLCGKVLFFRALTKIPPSKNHLPHLFLHLLSNHLNHSASQLIIFLTLFSIRLLTKLLDFRGQSAGVGTLPKLQTGAQIPPRHLLRLSVLHEESGGGGGSAGREGGCEVEGDGGGRGWG